MEKEEPWQAQVDGNVKVDEKMIKGCEFALFCARPASGPGSLRKLSSLHFDFAVFCPC